MFGMKNTRDVTPQYQGLTLLCGMIDTYEEKIC